jgi:hypothetical protein
VKTCTRCGEAKPPEDFHRDATKPDGHRAMCGSCVRAAQSARDSARIAAEHQERSAMNRAWRYWQFDYGGRLDFEDRWARERDRWLR